MGGGDLNLKKSWHPSTMKNIEKVWKAEQQQSQERKKIAELQREIEMEKDREDMKKYAMDQGVIEKKDDKKLDWMYKGPNKLVNREDYLLGRPIDKSFEQIVQAEKDTELNRAPRNHVEHECIPPSLRFFSGNEQVDLARKMQEDPLYAIKKKEMETRSQLLKNPVKLKQLRQLLEQQSKKSKSEKKQRKRKKHKQNLDSDDETQLDMLLAVKYKQLKEKMNDKDLIKSMKKSKHKRKKKSRKESDSSSSESESSSEESSSEEDTEKRKKKHRSKSKENNDEIKKHRKEEYMEKVKREYKQQKMSEKHTRDRSCSRERSDPSIHRKRSRIDTRDTYKNKDKDFRSKTPQDRQNDFPRSRYSNRNPSNRLHHKDTIYSKSLSDVVQGQHKEQDRSRDKWKKKHLTEEEKEKRRREMIANASWRDTERERNVKRYREEEKKESDSGKMYNQDFIRKQLASAAEIGTVASRIKANINNIQRSGRAMDTNFAKR